MPVCYPYFSLISLSNNAIHKFSDYRLNTISDRQDVATPLRAYCRTDERANTVRHCLQSVILISEQQTDNQQLYSINILQTREKYRESVKATNYIIAHPQRFTHFKRKQTPQVPLQVVRRRQSDKEDTLKRCLFSARLFQRFL